MPAASLKALGVLASAAALTIMTPHIASAAWADVGATRYASGTSGTVAASLQYDSGLRQFRGRGAADPNAGYGINLGTIELRQNNSTYPPYYDDVAQATAGSYSSSYQSHLTLGAGGCPVFYTRVYYGTIAGNFQLQSYSDQRCPA